MFKAEAESFPLLLVRQARTEASVNVFRDYATLRVLLPLQLSFEFK